MCCQPIIHSSARRFIFDLDFQFSKPPISLDVSWPTSSFAARLNLSEMDVWASMDDCWCEAPGAVGQFLSSGCTADLLEDGEISDFDNDGLPFFRKILV